jgi:hypothetical protein
MRKLFFLLPVLLVLLGSCKKEKTPGSSNPPAGEPLFSIALTKPYMDGSKIDSAIAVWEVNGQVQRIVLQLKNDALSADIQQFQPGNGKLSIQIISKLLFGGQYPSQWILQKQMGIEANKSVTLNGPSGFRDANWLPRVMLKDAVGHSAVVALRPEDSYFLIKDVPAHLLKLTVSREYYNGINKVAGGEWSCTTCIGQQTNIVNTDFFETLPQQLGNRPWNQIGIGIMYTDDVNGGGYVLSVGHIVN